MPNMMAALPNIGGALCSMPKVWLTPNTGMSCSNAAKTQNPLKLAGVPKLPHQSQSLVGRSSPYCGYIRRRYGCLTSFFLTVDMCISSEDIAQQETKLCDGAQMVIFWRLFASCIFSEPHAARFRPAS